MYILGINGGFRPGYQDVSAVLLKDGAVVAAVEEERLSRIKFSGGRLPYLSVKEVLRIGAISITDVGVVAFHGSTWEKDIESRIADYFRFHFGYSPVVQRFHHHDCHAASAYYASGFSDALVLTIDNSGDGTSTQVALGKKDELQVLKRFSRSNSLGFFYSLINQYCGFVKDSDEYKLMGLASYGNRNAFNFQWLIDFSETDAELKLNEEFVNVVPEKAPALHRDEMNFNEVFLKRMNVPRRIPGSNYSQYYKDVAASAQKHLEEVVLKMLRYYIGTEGKRNICLAGGVALNCVMNQRISEADFCENLFVQPASNDAGISLGAAWLACLKANIIPRKSNTTYLGSSYSNEEIKATLEACHAKYSETEDVSAIAAELISQNKVIGWFQGKMEFGPRALGSRSILANALSRGMNDLVNQKIKLREGFRPFCPSLLEEDAAMYFRGGGAISPYMTVTYTVRPEVVEIIPAVVHVDGTARVQTVNQLQNPLYYSLLQNLKKLTGHGVVLNTSFNLSHEPIVCTPRDALATFFSSGLDALCIGNFLVTKE